MMKMMEAKVFAALCALLIINFGSADDGRKIIRSSLFKIIQSQICLFPSFRAMWGLFQI